MKFGKGLTKKALAAALTGALAVTPCIPVYADETEDIELVWATFKGGWADVLEEIFAEYEKEHPNVHVTLYTGESGDFFGDLKALLAVDALPNIFNLRGDSFGREWKEYLQDVSGSEAVANVKEGFTDAFSWDGGIYGAYYNYEIHGNAWNLNDLEEAGHDAIPSNHDEYIKTLQDLQAVGKKGVAYFATQQTVYNFIGNAPIALQEDADQYYQDLVSGAIDPVEDKRMNEFLDWLAESLPYLEDNLVSIDQATATAACFTSDKYAWSFCDGTSGLYYGYDTDYTDNWEISPFCIADEDPYYVLNCQGYVVGKTGNEAVDAAALDLYNWFYTSDYVADTLTRNFSILTTSKSYELEEGVLDQFTYKASQAINTVKSRPITYYMPGTLCNDYAAILQRFAAGELSKEDTLRAIGEAFRSEG